ncbi:FtsX-like permease family protein [Oscillatoria sp. FACHB-1407]|uniref:ABC transporter permease DevC n=1 Tax=Oscillatoria sp. FACHB-1407 TaxID=2692847 RepID=UPI001681D6EA|nr:ABC transporter permease DevC [Oscillatoria sp. FACHB-1407]MBD2463106.1 FtsX-like permease family protein [Oscillatoria sp. FACHB-1407]
MFSTHQVPLAWLNLIHNRAQLMTSLASVAFAVLLMFMFTGFKNALYDSQVQLVEHLNADLVIISTLRSRLAAAETFPLKRLYQAQSFGGVEAVYPLYIQLADWKNPVTKMGRTVRVLAFNPSDAVFNLTEVQTQRDRLWLTNTVLMDRRSRQEVGTATAGVTTELAGRNIKVMGAFTLGTDFSSADGNIITSEQTFLNIFAPFRPQATEGVDIGLIRTIPGIDIHQFVLTLRQHLPDDVFVLTKAELAQQERTYWQTNTSIGFVFTLLSGMGFAVGSVLVYQILYTDIADHGSEYATLKAMGYTNRFLLSVVVQEALILSILGFVPGLLVSALLYHLAAQSTGLLFALTVERVLTQFVLTVLMCLISGAIAVRKVQATDPAEVFG